MIKHYWQWKGLYTWNTNSKYIMHFFKSVLLLLLVVVLVLVLELVLLLVVVVVGVAVVV